ncbi:MAG: class D beta-lactamase, partial [Mesorhizobium sp.]
RLVVDTRRADKPKGLATRAAFLKDLPGLIK